MERIDPPKCSDALQIVEQPRQPRNLGDLLRYGIEAQGVSVPQYQADNRQLDPERRQFLENALNTMAVNPVEELNKAIAVLYEDYSEGDRIDKFVYALDFIVDFTDNIDVANDFFKLGGCGICKIWLEKGPPEIKWRVADIIAECCENNYPCQRQAIDSGLLKLLMEIALKESNDAVKLKSFHAVSCISRNGSGFMKFLTWNGHKLIANCLKSPNKKLKTKVAFFTCIIFKEDKLLPDSLRDMGVVDELISVVTGVNDVADLQNDVSCFEQCLSALVCFVKEAPHKIKDNVKLINHLSNIREKIITLPECQESVDYINTILQITKDN